MTITVVDASALGALLFAEPEGADVLLRLEGNRLLAPLILPFEITNICLTKCRRFPAHRADLVAKLAVFDQMNIELREVRQADVFLLAESARLSSYDASYLWLARQLDADLVTLDSDLANAHALLRR